MLRRPDLLVSLLTYWQHHPSLSYLFSGRFVGPTSQAPRVDEGRPETLYELEIAFAEIDQLDRHRTPAVGGRPGAAAPADRHHRQHPPRRVLHRQALQPRLAARPARAAGAARLRDAAAPGHGPGPGAAGPGPGRPVRRGAATRPRWSAGAPSCTSGSCCRTSRWPTSPRWSPTCGPTTSTSTRPGSRRTWSSASRGSASPTSAGVELELRSAIEPWHVLGEEATSGGTARYVDSSTERLQVKVSGFAPGRHLLACNGAAVPLTPTGTPGQLRRRRPLQGLEAVVVAAPDAGDRLAAALRRRRPGQPALAGRCDLPRGAPGRPLVRPPAGQRRTRPRPGGRAGSRRWATPPGEIDVDALDARAGLAGQRPTPTIR